MSQTKTKKTTPKYSPKFIKEALEDFKTACISREASLMGRKEVLTGKAKFGIFGAGKEIAQVAMARVFKKGDFRSGYYRDQTFMLAAGLATIENLFAQLYAHADAELEPFSAGRQMNSHFATPLIDKNGDWLNHKELKNVSSDISPTGGQMARGLGLAMASKKYRNSDKLSENTNFSDKGNEVSFCCIGDASTSEGVFWESLNAAGVMQVPMAVFVWDDGYGISVPKEFQTTKSSISEALAGFHPKNKDEKGVHIYKTKGWDYLGMRELFETGVEKTRKEHKPCLFHVEEITQPQGHSTSGSHERYKNEARLKFELEKDGITQMKDWMVKEGFATAEELDNLYNEAKKEVQQAQKNAWEAFNAPIKVNLAKAVELLERVATESSENATVLNLKEKLAKALNPTHKDVMKTLRNVLKITKKDNGVAIEEMKAWAVELFQHNTHVYTSHLYSESPYAATKVPVVPAQFSSDSPIKNGYEILTACFDAHLTNNPNFFAFGEDVGKIGGVNQGFAGMQEKHGVERVFDTGIREWTIMGQAIGMAMRGLRPIGEIQYLDYLIYAISALSDDLSTVRYRTNATQKAPAIVRTRGHRLEGIWHSGSPMGMLLNSLKGMCLLVPRNMTQAAGFYNTLLQSDDPALVIECLNGYRLKEQLPDNIHEFTVPVGVPEILQKGTDVTLVTYGSCVRIAQEAMEQLEEEGVSVELIDVQSLMPFDIHHSIVESLKKTNRLVLLDEDFAGGGTAFMMHKILIEQKGYFHLDSEPVNIYASDVRPPYGSDGDYFTKPSAEDVFEKVYALMHEAQPGKYPALLGM